MFTSSATYFFHVLLIPLLFSFCLICLLAISDSQCKPTHSKEVSSQKQMKNLRFISLLVSITHGAPGSHQLQCLLPATPGYDCTLFPGPSAVRRPLPYQVPAGQCSLSPQMKPLCHPLSSLPALSTFLLILLPLSTRALFI